MRLYIALGALVGAGLAGAIAVAAQAQSLSSVDADGIRRMIVYGTDPCPPTRGDEIVICARRPDRDRYRVPERFREPDALTGDSEAWGYHAEQIEMVGAGGIASCSPVGPGGVTGCTQQLIQQSAAQRRRKSSDEEAFPED